MNSRCRAAVRAWAGSRVDIAPGQVATVVVPLPASAVATTVHGRVVMLTDPVTARGAHPVSRRLSIHS